VTIRLLEQAPRFDAAAAAAIARDLYGLEAAASPLASERDQNFLLESAAGRFVLKLANAHEGRALLDAQNMAMAHASAHGALCPRALPTRAGTLIGEVTTGGGTRHYVRLLTWIPGTPLGQVQPHPAPLLDDLGRRLGQLDAALATFDHAAIHRDFHWDLARGFETVTSRLDLVADPDLRALVASTTASVRAQLAPVLPRLRRGAIHNDANDYNVLVAVGAGDPPPRIAGFIDFGDMVHGFVVADLAVAIAYAVLDADDPLEVAAAIARGYRSTHPLTDDEVRAVLPFVQLRLCMSVCLAASQIAERPGDPYLAISQGPIGRTLPRLASIDPATAAGAIRGIAPIEGAVARRRRLLGPNLRVAYDEPLKIVRGAMQYLFDHRGRRYLDAYNNVPHVGHGHPAVVAAAAAQMRLLNTNTRYLNDLLANFAERLTSTLPAPLRICYFLNSGSEANELALRLARAHTRRRDLIVLEAAYHGNTTTLIDISPYKFNGPGGEGAPPWVHVVPLPDVYRGRHSGPDAAAMYARHVADLLDVGPRLRARGLCGFIAETCPSVAGQIMLPPGYLAEVYRLVREAGGVCIADEVQTAYGRLGTHFHAFEAHDVVPDIVVFGKPIGNGYPLGAVVTSPAIAASFDTGMEFFSTFGGSTVSCAVGLAVLDVVERERLQAHAGSVGERLLERLRPLQERHGVVGDVRGSGLFLGVELVRHRATREPAAREASLVVNRMRQEGILVGTDGPFHNVVKIRPPMPFSAADADELSGTLDRILTEVVIP
jgi:4-aminobutyrate aminotransferase-like enzyme/Ser/Thr protein kinase RdoA (MazF antagonist)